MFNKIKREHLFIFLFLAVTLIFFDTVGIDYVGITGATSTNVQGIQDAFENIFNILFQGFAEPLFNLFHLPVTGLIVIRLFLGLVLFAILFPVMGGMQIFGSEQNQRSRIGGIVAGLISLITVAFIPGEILNLFFGDYLGTGTNIFKSLLSFVFVIGTSILLMYGVSKIAGRDPQNNTGRSMAAGVGYLVILLVILYITSVVNAGNLLVSGLQTVFDISWAILLLACLIQFLRYTIMYPIGNLNVGPVVNAANAVQNAAGAIGGIGGPDRPALRTELDNALNAQRPLLAPFFGAGSGPVLMNDPQIQQMCTDLLNELQQEDNAVNAIQGQVIAGIADVGQRNDVIQALQDVGVANTEIVARAQEIQGNPGYTENQRRYRTDRIRDLLVNDKQNAIAII